MKIMKLIFILLLIIFLSCAVQGPPSGGRIDESSPQVINIHPINNKKNLKNDETITIYFNQMINPTSAKMAFNVFPETDIIVLIGEIGGQLEIEAATWVKSSGNKKPDVGFIAGETAPKGRKMGHAGAIVGGKDDTASAKKNIMRDCGIYVVDSPAEIGSNVQKILN